jgi:hypothetical protein
MEGVGLAPDVVTFNALISAYVGGVIGGETYEQSATLLVKGHAVLAEMRSRRKKCATFLCL